MQNFIRLVVLMVWLCSCIQAQISLEFQKCKRSGDDFNGCLKIAIQDALPKCENGIPEIGIPRLQPLNIPQMTVGDRVAGAVHVLQHYNDINIYNLTSLKINKVRAIITDNEFKLDFDGVMPEFIWDSDYDFKGRILLLPISGKGRCYAVGKRVKLTLSFVGKIYGKKEDQYVKILSAKMDLKPEEFSFNLKNLFNGDERLGSEMNDFLNANWKDLWEDNRPTYEDLFESIFLDYTNRFFKKVPLDQIFPL